MNLTSLVTASLENVVDSLISKAVTAEMTDRVNDTIGAMVEMDWPAATPLLEISSRVVFDGRQGSEKSGTYTARITVKIRHDNLSGLEHARAALQGKINESATSDVSSTQ